MSTGEGAEELVETRRTCREVYSSALCNRSFCFVILNCQS
jgi:hypothetical protein